MNDTRAAARTACRRRIFSSLAARLRALQLAASSTRSAGTLGSRRNAHCAGPNPTRLLKEFLAPGTMMPSVRISSLLLIDECSIALAASSFHRAPCRSTRPSCQRDWQAIGSCTALKDWNSSRRAPPNPFFTSRCARSGTPAQKAQDLSRGRRELLAGTIVDQRRGVKSSGQIDNADVPVALALDVLEVEAVEPDVAAEILHET